MAYLSFKIDSEMLSDARYRHLNATAQALFWSVLVLARKDGAYLVDLESGGDIGQALTDLENANLISIHDDHVKPTGRLVKRESRADYFKAYRASKNPKSSTYPIHNPPLIQPAPSLPISQPSPPPARSEPAEDFDELYGDDTQDYLDYEPALVPAAPHTELLPPKPAKAPKAPKSKPNPWADEIRPQLINDGLSAELADELIAHRTYKKAPLTYRAWVGAKTQISLAGWELVAGVEKWLEKLWTGIEAGWLINLPKPGALITASSTAGVPSGYLKNGQGRLIKRTGGVCL